MVKKAFTLIELLVVVAIIGILATVVVVNLSSAQAKARDSKRVSDIQQINQAIQLEATNRGSDKYYDSACNGSTWSIQDTALNTTLIPNYLPTMPNDPVYNTGSYNLNYVYYSPFSSRLTGTGGSCANPTYTSSWYYLWAGLDVANSSLANSSSFPFALNRLNSMKGPPPWGWDTSVSSRQDVNNFFVIKGGN